MDSASAFPVSNRSIHLLESRSNISLKPVVGKSKQTGILVIGNKSIDISATTEDIAKQMTPLNSVHQIGLSTSLGDVLIVVWGLSSAYQNNGNSGNRVRIYRISTTSAAIAK